MNGFGLGEAESYNTTGPVAETMGARYGIGVTQFAPAGRGAHEHLSVPYLMPSVHYRNGNMERVNPAIVQTPLGGMMPGPFAIPPGVPGGHVGAFPVKEGSFGLGVIDAWPEGSPVPVR